MTQNSRISKKFVGLIITISTLAAPIAWDWWSKKSDLTLNTEQSAAIIEKNSQVEGISIKFHDKEIDSLSKTTFNIKNTGRTPIESSDIISPILLKIRDGELLDATIESMKPENLAGQLLKDGNQIKISFPLLNPEDSIRFSILTTEPAKNFNIESRIKNISAINVTTSEDQIKIKSDLGVLSYLAFGIIGFLALVLFHLIGDIPKKSRAQNAIKKGEIPLHIGTPTYEMLSFVDNQLGYLTKNKRLILKKKIISTGEFVDEKTCHEIFASINDTIQSNSPAGGAFIVLILICACTYYLYSTLVI